MKKTKLLLTLVLAISMMLPGMAFADHVAFEFGADDVSVNGNLSITNFQEELDVFKQFNVNIVPERQEGEEPDYTFNENAFGYWSSTGYSVLGSTTLSVTMDQEPFHESLTVYPLVVVDGNYFADTTEFVEVPDVVMADGVYNHSVELNEQGYYYVNFEIASEAYISGTRFVIHVVEDGSLEETPIAETEKPSVEESDIEPIAQTVTAVPTSAKVLVNGSEKDFQAYNINGNNFFKLRDLSYVTSDTEKQFEVSWDAENSAISLVSNTPYTVVGGEMIIAESANEVTATSTTSTIYKDGEQVQLTAYNINGNNFFKLRDITKLFNIGVTWDGETRTIGIDTSVDYVAE